MRQALFLHSHEFQHLDHAGWEGVDIQRFLQGMFTVAAAETEGNGRDTLAHGNVGIGAAGNAGCRQAVTPADGRDAVCQGIGVQTAAGPFAEQLGFDVDRFPFSMGQEALKSLVQLVQFISIFRAQVDSEHGLCRNGIDRRAARDGADIVRSLWLGWHGQCIELADDAGRFGNGIGLAEMHPAVAAGGFDGDGIAAGADSCRHKSIESTIDGDHFDDAVVPIGHDLPHPLEIAQAFFADVEGKEQTLRRREL